MSIEIRVPTLGESVTEATVATWFKKPGDAVAVDEMLCELETDKVTVEVPSPAAGTLGEIVAEEGATVGVDALLATLSEGEGAAPAKAGKPSPAEAPAPAETPEPGPADSGGGETVAVMVPALGESVTEATVSTWFKAEGKTVEAGGQLAELAAGAGGAVQARAVDPRPQQDAGPEEVAEAEVNVAAAGRGDVENAPSATKMMAEKGLDPSKVEGTGKDGRIMKEDVQKALASPAPAPAEPAPAKAPPRAPVAAEDAAREERVKMTRLRQTIARRLKDAQNTAAMLTTYNEVDMSATMDLRKEYKDLFEKKHGVKLGFMSFFTKACCHALKEVPEVNAEIDGTDVVYKKFVHMGIAVGTPTGLVVPVVRDADQMSFAAIEKKINELGARARDGKLSMAEMQGGTFTISNGGVYGSLMCSPILNPPQSGILGMHKIQDRPMAIGGQVVIRPMMYLALSYDHRIVDGKGAVTFLVRVKDALEDPRRLLMDL